MDNNLVNLKIIDMEQASHENHKCISSQLYYSRFVDYLQQLSIFIIEIVNSKRTLFQRREKNGI